MLITHPFQENPRTGLKFIDYTFEEGWKFEETVAAWDQEHGMAG